MGLVSALFIDSTISVPVQRSSRSLVCFFSK
jgi:hypothetical protein